MSNRAQLPEHLFVQFERLRANSTRLGAAASPSTRSVAAAPCRHSMGSHAHSVEISLPRAWMRRRSRSTRPQRVAHSGERPSAIPSGDDKLTVYTRERGSGAFMRAISLPDDVDPATVHASYRDGVLQISIARRETTQPKRITVQ